jgi:hypothetical protein
MKLKDREWATCECCKQRTKVVQEESFGCDYCQEPIDDLMDNKDSNPLDVTVFYNDDRPVKHLHFCSWRCVFGILPSIETDHFLTLPYLSFGPEMSSGQTPADFFEAMLEWSRRATEGGQP